MKVRVLEYQAFKGPVNKVRSHKKANGKWKENKNFGLHKMLISRMPSSMLVYQKEYEVELK